MIAQMIFRKVPTFAVAALVLFPPQLQSQSDDVLIRLPIDQYARASRCALTGLRVYQRLPDFLVAGTDRPAYMQLMKSRIDASILDDRPWSESYAVASNHPGNTNLRKCNVPGCQILYSSRDFDIIKGPPAVFQRLRESGIECFEIDRREVPVDNRSTHLPRSVRDRPDDWILDVIANVRDSSIRQTIQGLGNLGTRYWNNVSRDSVARWVKARYLAAGVTDVVLDSFQYSTTWQANVVATIPGTVSPTAELIVGGHYDDMPPTGLAPGADDNGSGTAAALEMARVLKSINYQPAYTMRFMGFAAEEAGLKGSASYAQRARTANRDIRCMQNFDMIANRAQAPTDSSVYVVWYTTSEAFSDLQAAMMRLYVPLNPVMTTGYRSGSDSYSFWQQNYRSVFCIEKNFSQHYHTSSDSLIYLDMGFCANIAKAGLAMLLTLDMMPPSVTGLQVRDCGNGTSLYASWDSVRVPDWYRYKVYVGMSPGVYTSNWLSTTRWTRLDGLSMGTRYYVGVSILDIAGREGMITEFSAVPRTIPEPPEGLRAYLDPMGAYMEWHANLEMDIQGYNIYRSLHTNTHFVRMNSQPVSDTAWTDTAGIVFPRYYFLTAVDSMTNESSHSDTIGMLTGVGEPPDVVPVALALEQNYPNPFNPTTEVGFQIGEEGSVSLKVFDVLGQEVATLVSGVKFPGKYSVQWDAGGVAGGVYFYRLESNGKTETKRMLLLK